MTIWHPLRRLFERQQPVSDWPAPTLIEDPEPAQPERQLSPAAAPVHVLAGTALVRVKESTLIVERPDAPVFERPLELVSAVHIHGWGGITTPCIAALLAQGTPVIWRGATGFPIGCSLPLHSAGLEARRAQYRFADAPHGLRIAQALITAKIVNMKGVARRKATLRGRGMLDPLGHLARRAREARNREELFGIEGTATAQYFATWPDLISDRAVDIEWSGRSRRPPRDIINAMLSYAYALLAGECLCAIAASGLDPRAGFLHQPRAGRPALALDLMEPFRPLIADQAVLSGVNLGQVTPDLFEESEEGMRFTDAGRRTAIDLVEKRLSAAMSIPDRAEPLSYRAAIGLQAQALASALRDQSPFVALERA